MHANSSQESELIMLVSHLRWLYFVPVLRSATSANILQPLSATITAEFAPPQHRARMLAWVFYMQPIGYAFAALMTLAVTRGYRHSIPMDATNGNCDAECIKAVDRSWRLIIGIGAIPALIAVFFRRSIPESPLYTADVINQPDGATEDFQRLIGQPRNTELGPLDHEEPPQDLPPIPLLADNPQSADAAEEFGHRWKTYWESFSLHFFAGGYWRSLLGVSLAWCKQPISLSSILSPRLTRQEQVSAPGWSPFKIVQC